MPHRSLIALPLIALGLLLGGCSDDEEAGGDAPAAEADASATAAEANAPEEGHSEPEEDHSEPEAAEHDADAETGGPEAHEGSDAAAGTITLGAPGEFSLAPPMTVPAGRVEFAVANEGAIEHEVIFIRTDADSGDLPPDDAGGAAEDGAVTPIGSGHGDGGDPAHVGTHFDAGDGGTVSVDLEPGRYAVICNLPGHYAAGMHANIEVR